MSGVHQGELQHPLTNMHGSHLCLSSFSCFFPPSFLKARLSIGHHGERSLESFCQWQNEEFGGAKYLGNNQVPGARDDTLPVDAAVFVTRYGVNSD